MERLSWNEIRAILDDIERLNRPVQEEPGPVIIARRPMETR